MRMITPALLVAAVALTGCGAEVAGGAAVTGGLQATQAEQARAQQEQITKNLGAALQAGRAAASAAEGQ